MSGKKPAGAKRKQAAPAGRGQRTGSNVNIEFQSPSAKSAGSTSRHVAPAKDADVLSLIGHQGVHVSPTKNKTVVPKGHHGVVPAGSKTVAVGQNGGITTPQGMDFLLGHQGVHVSPTKSKAVVPKGHHGVVPTDSKTIAMREGGMNTPPDMDFELMQHQGVHVSPTKSKAVVPKGHRGVVPTGSKTIAMREEGGMIIPEGYTVRKIEPAKNYDVMSFARAMNPDFAPRLKKLFDPETEAAIEAQKTGIYIGWRCPEFKHDCQRVNKISKCFCGHLLGEHGKYTGKSVLVPCKLGGCKCKGFTWIPSRPEDVGEFWHQRRRDFDPSTWRAKCRCKHTHEEHDPVGMRRCKKAGCSCGHFDSNFLCAACDQHWERHQTFFETEDIRAQNGLPVGEMYLPFAEMPDLRNIALTGREDDDTEYLALTQGEGSIPRTNRPVGNDAQVNFGGASSSKSGFKPVYD